MMYKEHDCKIELVGGVEGKCLAIDDFRVAGSKPWGGGTILKTWKTSIEDILKAIAVRQTEDKKTYKFWYNGDFEVTITKVK